MKQEELEAHLQKQVRRLKVLPRGEDRPWGSEEEHGLKHELFRQLWNSAMHADHAEWIIDKVIETCKFCPSPAELFEIANTVPDYKGENYKSNHERWGRVGELCPECKPWGAFGWIVRNGHVEECSTCPREHVESPQIQALIAALNKPQHGQHAREFHSSGPMHALLARS